MVLDEGAFLLLLDDFDPPLVVLGLDLVLLAPLLELGRRLLLHQLVTEFPLAQQLLLRELHAQLLELRARVREGDLVDLVQNLNLLLFFLRSAQGKRGVSMGSVIY